MTTELRNEWKERIRRSYWLLFFAFCGVKLILLLFYRESPTLFTLQYETAAVNLLNGNGFSVAFSGTLVPLTLYPPGYSAFIACIYALTGTHSLFIQLVQIFLSGGALILLVSTVERYFKSRSTSIYFGYFLLLIPIFWTSELSLNTGASLAMSLAIFSFYFWHRFGYLDLFLAGFFLAGAVSVRSEFVILVPALAGLLFFRPKRLASISLFLAGCMIILTPLTMRNYKNFGVLTPLPGGGGLTLVNVIGKFYPDAERGFAFGDGIVLSVEKGNYSDLTYPHPYERDKDRLARCINFMKEHPGKFTMVLLKNAPRACLGHQIYLVSEGPGFQEHLAGGGKFYDFIAQHPAKFADIFIGFITALGLVAFATYYLVLTGWQKVIEWHAFLIPPVLFFGFFVVFGTLGRYTLPAYLFLAPISFLGINAASSFLFKYSGNRI